MEITIQDQLRCVEREINKRQSVYPWLVARGKMTKGTQDKEIATMQAVYHTLVLAERLHLHRRFNQKQEQLKTEEVKSNVQEF